MKNNKSFLTKFRIPIRLLAYAVVIAVVAILIGSGVIGTYYSGILVDIGINIILAVSLNIAVGYLGELPLGHAGFMAVGAYASALLLRALPKESLTYMFPVAIILGGIIAAIFGLLIGLPALRLSGDYLAIVTLGFNEIIRVILQNIDSLLTSIFGRQINFTYGSKGLDNIPKITTFLNAFICVGIVVLLIYAMMKSKHGRCILSIRDNQIAARSCGINVTFYKEFAFVVSAFFAGVAGALYASRIGILTPSSFTFDKSIEILVMVVFGGIGSMTGSIVSATILTLLPQLLASISDYRMLIYAFLLILVMVYNYAPFFAPIRSKFSFAKIPDWMRAKIQKKPSKEEGGESNE